MPRSWMDVVSAGLEMWSATMQDGGAVVGAMFALDVSEVLETQVRVDDVCSLAFLATIIRPDVRTECLVVVLADRVVVVWRRGLLRRSTQRAVIPKAQISRVTTGPGSTASTRGDHLLTIAAVGGEVVVALPSQHAEQAAALAAAAIGTRAGPDVPDVR